MTASVETPARPSAELPDTPALNPAELAARAWDLCFLRPLEAMRDADRAIALGAEGTPKHLSRATLSRAVARSIFADYDSALTDAQKANQLANECGDIRLQSWSHCIRGQIELARDHLDDAAAALDDAELALATQDDASSRARMINLRAALARRSGASDQTLAILSEDANAFLFEYPYEAGYAHSTLGNLYDARGEHDQALHHHRLALRLRREAGDKFGEAGSLNNIGNVQYQLGRFEDALQSHQDGLVLRKELRNPVAMGASLSNIGLILFVLERHEEAEHTLREAAKIQDTAGDEQGAANTRVNLAHALSALGRDDESLALAREAAEALAAKGDRRGESSAWLCVGETILRSANGSTDALGDATLCCEKALEIGNGIDAPEIVYRAHHGLAMAYRQRFELGESPDHARRSMEHWQRFYEAERSVINERARRNAHQLEAEYKAAKAEHAAEIERFRAVELQRRNSELETLNQQLQTTNRDKEAVLKELQRKSRELERLASTDGLTGVLNRRHLDRTLAQEFDRYRRYRHELAVVMVDLDEFKAINDQISHQVGDDVLRQVARILKGQIRHLDAVGRYGGDEFIVLLPETPLERAVEVAERIRQAIDEFEWHRIHPDAKVTASVGVAVASAANDADALIEAADAQLYLAKASGRNTVRGL